MCKVKDKEVMEIDLLRLFWVLVHKLWLILLIGILAACAAFGFTKYCVTPLYRTSVMIYVNNSRNSSTESVTTSDLNASQQLVNTYVNIISSDAVLEKVAESGTLPYTAAEIRDMMSASAVSDTEIFRVYIINPDPEMAAKIANTIAKVAPDEIAEIVEGSSVKIVDYAKVPTARYSPSYSKNILISAMLGIMLTAGVIVLLDLFDTRIKSEEDLEQLFPDMPILGVIPDLVKVNKDSDSYGYR